jgi:hypothetical protein
MITALDNLIDPLHGQIELAAQVRNGMTFVVELANLLIALTKQFEFGKMRRNGVETG